LLFNSHKETEDISKKDNKEEIINKAKEALAVVDKVQAPKAIVDLEALVE